MIFNFMKQLTVRFIQSAPDWSLFNWLISITLFYRSHRRFPNRNNVNTLFNDFLFYQKIDGRLEDVLVQFCTDKEFVKTFLAEKIGKKYVVPTLCTFEIADFQKIDFTATQRCVVKPTHGSGKVVFLDTSEVFSYNDLDKEFFQNYFNTFREKNYKYLRPKVIIEPLLFEDGNITDYKIFCLNGRAKLIQVDYDRNIQKHSRRLYDLDWKQLDVTYKVPRGNSEITKPIGLETMIEIAEKVAANFDFVRVDLYKNATGNEVLIGELTFCPESAIGKFESLSEEQLFSKIFFESV